MASRDVEKILADRKVKPLFAPYIRERLLGTLGLAWVLDCLIRHSPHALREDIVDNVANSGRLLLHKHEGHPSVNLQSLWGDVQHCLQGWNNEDLRRITVAWCQMIVKMVDEGLYPESGDQCVLTSLAITHEAMEVDPEAWAYDKAEIGRIRNVLMARAFERNYFLPNNHVSH